MTQRFDLIIIGAGSAGCVLADKLTRCGRHQVLLLEAGDSERRAWIMIPVGYGFTFSATAKNSQTKNARSARLASQAMRRIMRPTR